MYRQISDDEFIYVNSFNAESKRLLIFSLEKFKDQKLVHKITASRIKYDPRNVIYLYDYTKRTVGETNDVIVKPQKKRLF
jgi:lipopolysaccharide export system permease protein